MHRVFFVGLLVLAFPVASPYAQVEIEPNHQFELEEVLSIGDDESAPREYLFSNPEYIRTDADGRIYVVEGRGFGSPPGTRVRVFGPDGTLQKIGPIEGFEHDKTEFEAVSQAVSVFLLWVGRRDRQYLEDRRSEFPVLRVTKLEE